MCVFQKDAERMCELECKSSGLGGLRAIDVNNDI